MKLEQIPEPLHFRSYVFALKIGYLVRMNKIEKSKTNFVKYIFFNKNIQINSMIFKGKKLDSHWSSFDEAYQL